MKEIKILVDQDQQLTGDQIINIIAEIGRAGDIIIVKNDGLRLADNYTVVITSGTNKFDSIRYDSNDLDIALKNALRRYLQA